MQNGRDPSLQMITSRRQPEPLKTPNPWALRAKRSNTQKERSPAERETGSQKGDFDIRVFQNQSTVKNKRSSMESRGSHQENIVRKIKRPLDLVHKQNFRVSNKKMWNRSDQNLQRPFAANGLFIGQQKSKPDAGHVIGEGPAKDKTTGLMEKLAFYMDICGRDGDCDVKNSLARDSDRVILHQDAEIVESVYSGGFGNLSKMAIPSQRPIEMSPFDERGVS